MKAWPSDWPEYHNANVDACDMAVGPCACGATHGEREFHYEAGTLFRYGEPVAGREPSKSMSKRVWVQAGREGLPE